MREISADVGAKDLSPPQENRRLDLTERGET